MHGLPTDLVTRYRDGRLILFVGSGVSNALTWDYGGLRKRGVSWRALVDQAAKMLDFPDPDLLRVRGTDLQILEYFSRKKGGSTELTNWFLREMNPPDDVLLASAVHKNLAALELCELMYTTNFDDFLERSFNLFGRRCSVIANEMHIALHHRAVARLRSEEARPCEIVKFHGDLNNPDRMVLSESDYQARLSFASVEDQRLRADLLGRVLLFVGYSFSDWNVAYLFRLVEEIHGRSPESRTGIRAYITIVEPSDFEYSLFDARHIEVIPLSSERTSDDLAGVLQGLVT